MSSSKAAIPNRFFADGVFNFDSITFSGRFGRLSPSQPACLPFCLPYLLLLTERMNDLLCSSNPGRTCRFPSFFPLYGHDRRTKKKMFFFLFLPHLFFPFQMKYKSNISGEDFPSCRWTALVIRYFSLATFAEYLALI